MSCVMYHVSHVKSHMSHVTCHVSDNSRFFLDKAGKSVSGRSVFNWTYNEGGGIINNGSLKKSAHEVGPDMSYPF